MCRGAFVVCAGGGCFGWFEWWDAGVGDGLDKAVGMIARCFVNKQGLKFVRNPMQVRAMGIYHSKIVVYRKLTSYRDNSGPYYRHGD